jgi:hypothetical protein
LEHSLLSMSPQGGPAKAEAKKPAAAPPVRPPPPFVPPAPAFTPKPASAARPTQPALVIDDKAFAHIEAMDAAARAKLFA